MSGRCGIWRPLPNGTRLTCLLKHHMPFRCVFANDPWWRRWRGYALAAIPVSLWLHARRVRHALTRRPPPGA